MILSAEKFLIRLPRPFRIAHGVSSERETILVRLTDPATGLVGHGEGALPPYYPSTAQACLDWLDQSMKTDPPPPEAAAAAVALDIARHDLEGQRAGLPLWKLWELDPANIPAPVRTLSIPLDEKELKEQFEEGFGRGFRNFKLKSGSGDIRWDEDCARLARGHFPRATVALDVNAGWTPEQAAALLPKLADWGIDLIEQPVAREWSAWRDLRRSVQGSPIPPLVADESVQGVDDLARAREVAEGVNIKLLKAGGLSGAREWLAEARRLGLKVMIGVMVETGIGRTAAAQLAPLADWLDIDPPDAIPTEPLVGFRLENGRLHLSESPGLGLKAP